jgi:uncharacterized protein YndB with AHSA1/START domain
MRSNLQFDFSVDKENKRIVIKREFAADVPTVWDAYTKSDILDKWWAPKPWKARTKKMDFRDGGQWLYAMVGPNGEEHWSLANYKNIQPHQRYSAEDAFCDADGNINEVLPQSKWEVSFSKIGSNTLVEYQISFDDLSQLEDIIKMGFKEGITMAMDGLDELLASSK